MSRKHLTPKQRQEVFDKTFGKCAYCGCRLTLKTMTADHVLPLARGGADEMDNLLPACQSCNHRKGTFTLDGFRSQLEQQPNVLARDSVTYRNAVRYGLVIPNPHRIKFYFEKLEAQQWPETQTSRDTGAD